MERQLQQHHLPPPDDDFSGCQMLSSRKREKYQSRIQKVAKIEKTSSQRWELLTAGNERVAAAIKTPKSE